MNLHIILFSICEFCDILPADIMVLPNDTDTPCAPEIRRLRVKVSRLKKKLSNKHILNKKDILDNLERFLEGPSLSFIKIQLEMSGRKKKGFRWSDTMKALAVTLFHTSPKCYRLLQKLFNLPSVSTLKKIMKDINIHAGFSEPILQGLKNKVDTMNETDKICSIVFDEMTLKENLFYNSQLDSIEGLQDLGMCAGRSKFAANQAAVFMVRGLASKWKQPIAFFLSSGPVRNHELKSLVFECIRKVRAIGLKPMVFLCDQGSNNRSAISSFDVSVEQPYFSVDNERVYVMYDPPHLIKNVRNHFKSKGFKVEGKPVEWKYVEMFYRYDSSNRLRLAPKLTSKHIRVPAFSGMRVKLATQVLSHSVAAGLYTYCNLGKISKDGIPTADFIEKMNMLFDCFNSSQISGANSYRRAISADSCHMAFLESCKQWLSKIHVLGSSSARQLPCIVGWQLSINSLIMIWEELRINHSYKFLLTNRLNQDCLENFFSVIRGKGGHCFHPNPVQFRTSFRASAVDSLFAMSKGSNCMEDMDVFLLKLNNIPTSLVSTPFNDDSSGIQPASFSSFDVAPVSNELNDLEENALAYICGYVTNKCYNKFQCDGCKTKMTSTSFNYEFLKNKQYNNISSGGLLSPSPVMVDFIHKMEGSFNSDITSLIHQESVKRKLFQKLSSRASSSSPLIVCGSTKCADAINYMTSLYINIRFHHILREQNRRFREPHQKKNRKAINLNL